MYEVMKSLSGPFNSQSRRARCAKHASVDMVISRVRFAEYHETTDYYAQFWPTTIGLLVRW